METFLQALHNKHYINAIWVRLNELPIELYEVEVLRQIGESIGRVLWIDTHITMEAQGKYARLCTQIDARKPLVNTRDGSYCPT